MSGVDIKHRKKVAARLTLSAALTLCFGGLWTWLIVKDGGPEALGALFPLFIIGGVHLVAGPIAIYQSLRVFQLSSSYYVYIYFGLFLLATIWYLPPDIFVYVIAFIGLSTLPISFYVLSVLLKPNNG